ncbi:hypothetical protein H9L14_02005 [Sphingomonas sediminicola]|uniref:Uncharacterized protein n=1 Tax=Sphingomonas sediminicola TaxID=386874 RepID=A0ABX6T8U7_9SPHN|nr:hypothetical protein [Sphingomonas sediminicola]QNP46070.1 hypothetical protein H9L14_02005 [Sphingomonas sediminicola]
MAAVSSCQQTAATRGDRTTPYKIALFQTRTDEFRKFMTAGQRLDAAFRKALFVNPVYMETSEDALKMTDAQLQDANAKVAFMIDEYTTWLNDAQAVNVGWTPETTMAVNRSLEASERAMGCYFAFGPSARTNVRADYWAGVRQRTAQECPKTRASVVQFDEALLEAYNLMKKDIDAVTLPNI